MLDGQGLAWFVFGAQAVAVRGAPRATQDIDVTVQVERTRLGRWSRRLETALGQSDLLPRLEEAVAALDDD